MSFHHWKKNCSIIASKLPLPHPQSLVVHTTYERRGDHRLLTFLENPFCSCDLDKTNTEYRNIQSLSDVNNISIWQIKENCMVANTFTRYHYPSHWQTHARRRTRQTQRHLLDSWNQYRLEHAADSSGWNGNILS